MFGKQQPQHGGDAPAPEQRNVEPSAAATATFGSSQSLFGNSSGVLGNPFGSGPSAPTWGSSTASDGGGVGQSVPLFGSGAPLGQMPTGPVGGLPGSAAVGLDSGVAGEHRQSTRVFGGAPVSVTASKETGSFDSTAQTLLGDRATASVFGLQDQKAAHSAGSSSKPSLLFGATSAAASTSAGSSSFHGAGSFAAPKPLFGQPNPVTSSQRSASGFAKPSAPGAASGQSNTSSTAGIFGQVSKPSQFADGVPDGGLRVPSMPADVPQAYKPLSTGSVFSSCSASGKTDMPTSSVQSLFAGTSSSEYKPSRVGSLFGKPDVKRSADQPQALSSAAAAGHPFTTARDVSSEAAVRSSDGAATGLFGKPASHDVASDPSQLPREKAVSLFGKRPPQDAGDADPRSAATAGGGKRVQSLFGRVVTPAERPSHKSPVRSSTLRGVQSADTGGSGDSARRTLSRAGLFGKASAPYQSQRPSHSATAGVTGGSAPPHTERTVSADEIKQLTSLLCKDVPESCNDRKILLRHFSKFGTVEKLVCSRDKATASVQFADHVSAEQAKRRGSRIHPKLPAMGLFWRQLSRRRSSSSTGSCASPAAAVKATRRPRQLPGSDVEDELRSMQGLEETGSADAPPPPRRRTRVLSPSRRHRPGSTAVDSFSAATTSSAAPLQAPASPLAAAAGPATSSSSCSTEELRATMRKPAVTVSERYRALDARDKLIREELRRESGGKRCGPLVGTCPDMCPEKERYMREEKHLISGTFERRKHNQPGSFDMDHRLAVKQYSRSSADQEEPLSHELRTPAALRRTMHHLLRHVLDRTDADPADWFLYVWDRTRSLRKDLTQQQLTDPTAVQLVEQCARFHVYCAAALSQMSRDVFDQKINNENLTKCLQSLKHLYHDLSVRGIQCPNEAEFRGYDILLNLNQGDILREAQTYSDAVRDSESVQSALRLYVALSSNNYVRFFKLCRLANHLQSCLLQRYMTQARTRALDIITRAVCPPKRLVEYPMEELVRILAFEDETECSRFLRLHGLESEQGIAFLERALYEPPDTAPPLPAAPSLIHNKLNTSVGQAINGGPLPEDPLPSYEPQDSFRQDNVLCALSYADNAVQRSVPAASVQPSADIDEQRSVAAASVHFVADTAVHRTDTASTGSLSAGRPQDVVSAQLAQFADSLLKDVTSSEVRRICSHVLTATTVTRDLAAQLYMETQRYVLLPLIRSVCEAELAAAHQLHREKIKLEHLQRQQDAAIRDLATRSCAQSLLLEVCSAEALLVCQSVLHELESAARRVAVDRAGVGLCTELCDSVLQQLFWDTSAAVMDEFVREERARQQAVTRLGRRLLLRRWYRVWCDFTRRQRHLRAERRRFPAHPRPLSPHAELCLLGGPAECQPLGVDRQTDMGLCHALLEDRMTCHRVRVDALLCRQLRSAGAAHSGDQLWKLTVQLVDDTPADELSSWLLEKLTDPHTAHNHILQRGSADVTASGGGQRRRLFTAVRRLGTSCSDDEAALRGCSAVLLAVPVRDAAVDQLLAQLGRVPPGVPVAVVAPSQLFGLIQRTFSGLPSASDVRCFHIHAGQVVASNNTLLECLTWLFERRPVMPRLERCPLRRLAERYISAHVIRRFYLHLHRRRNKGRVETSPEALVSLYNGGMQQLMRMLTGDAVSATWWPPEELLNSETDSVVIPPLDWNSETRLSHIQQMVDLVMLPKPLLLTAEAGCSWRDCSEQIIEYSRSLSLHGVSSLHLTHRLKCILDDWLWELRSRCVSFSMDDDFPVVSVPWTDIITCCIEHQLCGLSSDETVYYLQHQFEEFHQPTEWLHITAASTLNDSMVVDDSLALTAVKPRPVVDESNDRSALCGSTETRQRSGDAGASPRPSEEATSDWERRLTALIAEGECAMAADDTPPCLMESAQTAHLNHPSRDVTLAMDRLFCHLSEDRRASSYWSGRLEALLSESEDKVLSYPAPV